MAATVTDSQRERLGRRFWNRTTVPAVAVKRRVQVSLLMLLTLLISLGTWAPWMHEAIGGRQLWLNAPFLIARQVLGFLLLGSIPGIAVGSRVTSTVPDWLLRLVLAMILTYAGVLLLRR